MTNYELVKHAIGGAAEGFGISRKTILNWRERYDKWPSPKGTIFRADVFDLAEMLAMKKLIKVLGGEDAAPIAAASAVPIGYFALLSKLEAVEKRGEWGFDTGAREIISQIVSARFDIAANAPRPAAGLAWSKCGGRRIFTARRWMFFYASNYEGSIVWTNDINKLDSLYYRDSKLKAEPGTFVDLKAVGEQLADSFHPLVQIWTDTTA